MIKNSHSTPFCCIIYLINARSFHRPKTILDICFSSVKNVVLKLNLAIRPKSFGPVPNCFGSNQKYFFITEFGFYPRRIPDFLYFKFVIKFFLKSQNNDFCKILTYLVVMSFKVPRAPLQAL